MDPRGFVPFGGLSLRFTINAICDLEAETGQTFTSVAADLSGETFSFQMLRRLIRVGLSHARPGITDKEVGDLIDAMGLAEATKALEASFAAAFPQGDGTEKN